MGDVVLPLKGFTDHWDDATGKAITTCADDSTACPTQNAFRIWKPCKFGARASRVTFTCKSRAFGHQVVHLISWCELLSFTVCTLVHLEQSSYHSKLHVQLAHLGQSP